MQTRNAYPSVNLDLSFLGLAYVPIVDTSFPELAQSFLAFSPCISFDLFSILLTTLPATIAWPYVHFKTTEKHIVLCVCSFKFHFQVDLHVYRNKTILLRLC